MAALPTGASLPTGRPGQALALGIAALLMLLVWFAAVAPLLGWHAGRQEALVENRALEGRMAALVASLPALRQAVQSSGASQDAAPGALLIDAPSDAIAGADLQQRLQDMARQAGINLASVETLSTQPEGAWRRIGLRLTLAGPYPVLVDFLRAIAQASPRMLVDDLQMQASAALQHPDGVPMNASVTVYAFRAGGSA